MNFCKISNPYENTINEKITKTSELYRRSYLKGILLLIGIVLLILLALLLIIIFQFASFSENIKSNYDCNIVINNKLVNLLNLYSQSSILYQLHVFPQQFYQIDPSYNLADLITDYS
jgi:hypothetical protein